MSKDLISLFEMPIEELRKRATDAGIVEPSALHRADLVFAIAQEAQGGDSDQLGMGVLETHGEGFGFLRSAQSDFLPGPEDIYVSQSQIRRFRLHTGDTIIGQVRPPKEGERYAALLRVEVINGTAPGSDPATFDNLTAIRPEFHLKLYSSKMLKAIDRVAPLGLGHRGLIIAPPRTGRVELLQQLANALQAQDELEVTVLLTAAAPEEIQEWRKVTTAQVIATPLDEPQSRHLQSADIVFERARRQAEHGDDAVVIVDSLSRLARACLAELPPTERNIGGLDSSAIHRIRRFMGAARALEEGGSLTIIGALSGDKSSRTDNAIIDDLSEAINWRLELSRPIADRGIRPAIDIHNSGTRREEILLSPDELKKRNEWRASLTADSLEDISALISSL